jgi:tetratricopeptide (TPR) repeat protein
MADSWWEAGAKDGEDALGYHPFLLDLKAPLRTAQRRFSEAIELLDTAAELFLNGEHPDPHLAGRSMISKAGALIELGDLDSALLTLKKANGLIDPEREPRLQLCLHHNLVDNLSKAGHHQEAAALLPELKTLAQTHGTALDRLRLTWVEGRIATGLGHHDQARTLLATVRHHFLTEGNHYEAALATLDLVIPHLHQGDTLNVRHLADEMVTIFQAHDVPRESLAALLLFQQAARQDTATTDLARDVAASLTKACKSAPK